jgi:hypothetical protein
MVNFTLIAESLVNLIPLLRVSIYREKHTRREAGSVRRQEEPI